jgi:REP element-mobilizing transposase RayT
LAAISSLHLHFKNKGGSNQTKWLDCLWKCCCYREQRKYLLHEFVVMPDHFHLLITPIETLERALQLIKGSFSFRAKKELGFVGEIWQKSFYDRGCETLPSIVPS